MRDNVSGKTKEVEKNTKPAHFPRKRTKPAQFSSRFATYHAHIPGEDSETLMFPSLCRASLLNLRLFLALLLFFFFFHASIECHMCRRRKKKSISLCNQFSSHCDCTVPRYTRFTLYTHTHRTHFIRCSCRRDRRENRSVELLLNTRIQLQEQKGVFGGKKVHL